MSVSGTPKKRSMVSTLPVVWVMTGSGATADVLPVSRRNALNACRLWASLMKSHSSSMPACNSSITPEMAERDSPGARRSVTRAAK